MDTVLQALLSWQFVLFCLAVSAIVFVVRKFAEYAMENWAAAAKESKLWRELILPILPIVLGTACAFLAKKYPYPDGLNTGSARIAFGLVAGLLSGLVYKVVKGTLSSKLAGLVSSVGGTAAPAPSAPPAAAAGTPDAPADPGASVRNTINNG
jgi:hydrogenase-4 membrane subunit HyfE